jgi:hypothetical protein
VFATLLIYWTKWSKVQLGITGLIIGVGAYLIIHFIRKHKAEEILGGLYLIVYILILIILSYLGNFGGISILPEPYMSLIVAIVGFVFYYLAVYNGVWYMHKKGNIAELEKSTTN